MSGERAGDVFYEYQLVRTTSKLPSGQIVPSLRELNVMGAAGWRLVPGVTMDGQMLMERVKSDA